MGPMTPGAAFLAAGLAWLGQPGDAGPVAALDAMRARQAEMRVHAADFDRKRLAGHTDAARAVLSRMLRVDSLHPETFQRAAAWHADASRFDEAAALVASLTDAPAGRLFARGVIEVYRRRFDEAERAFKEALAAYEGLGHLAGQAATHAWLGRTLRLARRFDAAQEQLEAARLLFDQLDDTLGLAEVLDQLGRVASSRLHHDEAIALQREALALAERAGERRVQGLIEQALGTTLRLAERYDEAAAALERGTVLLRGVGDLAGLYRTVAELARVQDERGDGDLAVGTMREAVALAAQTGEPALVINAQLDLGWALRRRGLSQEVAQEMRAVLAAADRTPGVELQAARASLLLGEALSSLGRFEEAEQVLERTVAMSRTLQKDNLVADARTGLASIRLATGRLAQALVDQQAALEILRAADRLPEQVIALNNLATIHHRAGEVEAAEVLLREALQMARRSGNARGEALAQGNLGSLLAGRGRLEAGLAEERAALERWRSINDPRRVAWSRVFVADTLRLLGRREEALAEIGAALGTLDPLDDHEGVATAAALKADVLRDGGDRSGAIELYDRALERCLEHGLLQLGAAIRTRRGVLHEQLGRAALALEDYRASIEVLERIRGRLESDELKMRFLAREADVYLRAVLLQRRREIARAPAAPEAFALAERARARSLVELLTESRASLREGVPTDLVERERQLLDDVGEATLKLASAKGEGSRRLARDELRRAEQRRAQIEITLRRSAPGYAQIVYPQPATLSRLQTEVLAADETLLSYFAGREAMLLWIVERQRVQCFVLPPPDRIEQQVAKLIDAAGEEGMRLGASVPGAAEAEALAAELLPIPLSPGRRLLVAPDGPLHHLPFDLLRPGGTRYLVEDHEVVVVPSATVLAFLRSAPPKTAVDGFLGVGAPPSTGAAFPDIPESREGLVRIARSFPEDRRTLLVGAEATKERLQALDLGAYRYIHFATHGWLDREASRHLALYLAAPPGEVRGELLSCDDVLRWRLAAEAVVLAACQSGQGELLRGEGLVGMTRAFLHAGARSLLVSLWNVPDRQTAELMDMVYGHLAAGRTVPDALRLAKLAFIGSERPALRAPARWAPFVLVGDPSRRGADLSDRSAR